MSNPQDDDESMEWLCADCRRAVEQLMQLLPAGTWDLESAQYGACSQASEEGQEDSDLDKYFSISEESICWLFFGVKDSDGFRIPIFLAGKHPMGVKGSLYLQVSDYETSIFGPDPKAFAFDLEEVLAVLKALQSRSCLIERLEIGQGWFSGDRIQLVALIDDQNGPEKELRLDSGQFVEGKTTYNAEWEESLDFVDSAPPLALKRSRWRRILGSYLKEKCELV